MLSVFPSLLSYNMISAFLLRISLGLVFIFWTYREFKKNSASPQEKGTRVIEVLAGILLIIGLWTQVAALAAITDLLIRIIGKIKSKSFLTNGVNYYLLLLIISISLLVTGPGFFAFDLPL